MRKGVYIVRMCVHVCLSVTVSLLLVPIYTFLFFPKRIGIPDLPGRIYYDPLVFSLLEASAAAILLYIKKKLS